jgi:hypothetical protein
VVVYLALLFPCTSPQRFSVPEAVQYYVLLLAHVLVDPDFLNTCLAHRSGAGKKRASYCCSHYLQRRLFLCASE